MSSSQQKPPTGPSDQELAQQFNAQKQELQSIAAKISELEMERDEHKLVIDTIEPLSSDRKCFRLIGGVLVERTVADVLPQVTSNLDGIKQMIEQLLKTYKTKELAHQEFQKKHNIVVRARQ